MKLEDFMLDLNYMYNLNIFELIEVGAKVLIIGG